MRRRDCQDCVFRKGAYCDQAFSGGDLTVYVRERGSCGPSARYFVPREKSLRRRLALAIRYVLKLDGTVETEMRFPSKEAPKELPTSMPDWRGDS